MTSSSSPHSLHQQYQALSQQVRALYGQSANHISLTSQLNHQRLSMGLIVGDAWGTLLDAPLDFETVQMLTERLFELNGPGNWLLADPNRDGAFTEPPEETEPMPWPA